MSGSLGAVAAVGGPAEALPVQGGAVVAAQPQTSAPADADAFARELGVRLPDQAGAVSGPHAAELQAPAPSAGHHVSADMSERFHALSDRISSLDHATASLDGAADPAAMSPASLMQELGRYSSLVFVATVSSNGASEGSKMFNTLLKGQ
jgi:hypothetical protein